MSRLIALGDSFIWGSELKDNTDYNTGYIKPSASVWPALLAKELNYEYVPIACPGVSNSWIERQFIAHCDLIKPDDFVVIAWTYCERWEFFNEEPIISKHLNPTLYLEDDQNWVRHGDLKPLDVANFIMKYLVPEIL